MTDPAPPPDRHLLGPFSPWIVVVVLVALGLGVVALSRALDPKTKDADLYDVEKYKVIPPERIGYREVARIDPGLEEPAAIAVGPDDEIAVGGDRVVLVFAADGSRLRSLPLAEKPRALAYAPDGALHVALRRAVLEESSTGALSPLFVLPGEKARITSIAVDRRAVYAADAGARIVWKHGRDGELLGRIGDEDLERDVPCFNVPSPYFDVLVAPDGLLRIVDPGRHLITAFTPEGDRELSWGDRSFELEGFSGCCNPSHLAMLPDGCFVTSEKGIPRVKVYDPEGRFLTAVVGPEGLSTEYDPCDVAVDRAGRVLALDPGARVVRVFEHVGGDPRGE